MPAEECEGENWLDKLEEIELTLEDQPELTSRLFDGGYQDATEGNEYQQEWSQDATHGEDKYKIVWQFEQVKGLENEADYLDFDESKAAHLHRTNVLGTCHVLEVTLIFS